MGKLFNLKKWLTVEDAARHLSIVFGEEVTDADVLRLALDGHLRLSVNFVNHAHARIGKVIPLSEAKKVPGLPVKEGQEPYDVVLALRLNDSDFLELGEEITTLTGVWDLPMIGTEGLDIENEYQNLTDGPAVTLQCLDGAFVKGQIGQLCQLQESFEENEHARGSKAEQRLLEQCIARENLEPSTAQELLDEFKEARKKFLAKAKSNRDAGQGSRNYYPAAGLPQDSVLVVRTDALREFEESVNDEPVSTEKPLTITERNTLLVIIAALCDYSAIKHQERGAAGQIATMTEELGAPVTDDTVRKALARIPDALEARMK